ncbi:hypothetical protein ACFVZH_20790 [Streptomyces sp. NPDC059534]|uniref:hypothetical protein n=1 Tax=Streptomyces sp. NPDC059534 TaxID=3346859 RepID=UPI0036BFBF9F
MSAPAVEAATVVPQRRRIAVGKKFGRGPFVVEMSENDKKAHDLATHVRTQPAR